MAWHLVGFGVFVLYVGLFVSGFVWSWRLMRGVRLDLGRPKTNRVPARRVTTNMFPSLFVAIVVGLVASAPAYALSWILDAAH